MREKRAVFFSAQTVSLHLHHPWTFKLLRLKECLFLWQQVGGCFQSLSHVFAVNRSVRLEALRYCLQELQQVQGHSQAAGWKCGLAVMRNATGCVCAIRAKRHQQECYWRRYLRADGPDEPYRRCVGRLKWCLGTARKERRSPRLQLSSAYRQSLMSVTLMCSRRRQRMFLRRVLLFWSPNLCRFQRKKASFCHQGLFSLLNANSAKRQPLPAHCGLIVCVIAFPSTLCLYTYD